MSDLVLPPAPVEQRQLRGHLEHVLTRWGATYRHEDVNRTFTRGRGAICGWGTLIDRGPRRVSLHVWFDYLDRDITIQGSRTEYREWRDLSSMEPVLEDVTHVLGTLVPHAA